MWTRASAKPRPLPCGEEDTDLTMTKQKPTSVDKQVDGIFAGAGWFDACMTILAACLDELDACRDDPQAELPSIAPPIVEQVTAIAERAQQLQLQLRWSAEQRGPAAQTLELGAMLWWAGMGLHKGASAAAAISSRTAGGAWDDALYEIHALLYDTVSALALLCAAQAQLEKGTERAGSGRPN